MPKQASKKKANTPSKQTAKPKKVSAIPKGYHTLTPYLIVADAARAIAFYQQAFQAKVGMRMENPEGKICYAELKIGDSKFMLADEYPDKDALSPQAYQGSPVMLHVYVKGVDAVIENAVKLGAKLIQPIEDRFYGDRCGMLEDPHGHRWCVSTHIEDVSPAKLKKRAAEFFSQKT